MVLLAHYSRHFSFLLLSRVVAAASPQRLIVELHFQQVPHSCLCRIVYDELVVEEAVTSALAHASLHARAHGHGHVIPGIQPPKEKKRER